MVLQHAEFSSYFIASFLWNGAIVYLILGKKVKFQKKNTFVEVEIGWRIYIKIERLSF